MKYVVIVGMGGFAREILWLLQEINSEQATDEPGNSGYQVLGFVSESSEEELKRDLGGFKVVGDDKWVFENLERTVLFVPAIGDPEKRRKIAEKYLQAGFRALTLVHPSVNMADDVMLGQGVILFAGAILTTNIKVGDFVTVNLNATVGHDCSIGSYSTIHPGVNVSGSVTLGEEVELGTGSALLQGVTIGDRAVVGAGAVVTKDLVGDMTYVGIPAQPIG